MSTEYNVDTTQTASSSTSSGVGLEHVDTTQIASSSTPSGVGLDNVDTTQTASSSKSSGVGLDNVDTTHTASSSTSSGVILDNVDTTQTASSSTPSGVRLDKDYVKTIPGILKIVECALCIISFMCAIGYSVTGAAWGQFVTFSAFISTLIFFLLHLFRILGKLSALHWTLIELIYYSIYTVLFPVTFVIAVYSAVYHHNNKHHGAIIATAIFTFIDTAVFAVDTFFQFRHWQECRGSKAETATTTATITNTNDETRTE